MRRKNQGTILLIIGIYFGILNPISSFGYAISQIGAFFPYDPVSYWFHWLMMTGLLTITLGIIGVYFVVVGYRFRKWSQDDE